MSTTTLSTDAQAIVDDLLSQGRTPDDIRRAMEDGEYLGAEGISQDVAEDIHDWAVSADMDSTIWREDLEEARRLLKLPSLTEIQAEWLFDILEEYTVEERAQLGLVLQ